MHISVTDAKGHLADLVRPAEAGDEIILTRRSQPAVRLVPIRLMPDPKARRKLVEGPAPSTPRRGRTPQEAKTSCTGNTVCPND